MPKKPIPIFHSETDEVRWWAAQQEHLDEYLDLEPVKVRDFPSKLGLPPEQEAIRQAVDASLRHHGLQRLEDEAL